MPSGRCPKLGIPAGTLLPGLFERVSDRGKRFWEFFTAASRNKACFVAVAQFSTWCERKKPRLEQYSRPFAALEKKALIERTPGRARSIRVLVPAEQLPPLE